MNQRKLWQQTIVWAACALGVAAAHGQLFVDTFDRADSDDISSGLPTGQSGALAPITWNEVGDVEAGGTAFTNIASNALHLAYGPNASVTHLEHNFTDLAITSAGGMTVSMDLVSNDGNNNDQERWVGFGVGATQAEAEAALLDFNAQDNGGQGWRGQTDITTDGFADFFVCWAPGYTSDGTNPCDGDLQAGSLLVFRNGVLIDVLDNDGNCFPVGTIELRLAITDFNQNSPVVAEIHMGGVAVKSYRFPWDNSNANYIGVSARQNSNGFTVDNMTVSAGATITMPPTSNTWTGDGTDANWGTGDNWDNGVPDFAAADADLYFPLSNNAAPNNEAAGRTIANLSFDPGAQAYTIGGMPFTVTGSVTNNGATAQAIDATIISDGAEIGATFADLNLASVEIVSASVVGAGGVVGDRDSTTIASLAGSGDISLSGTGLVTLTGDNSSYAGMITLPREDDCGLVVSHSNALGAPSAITWLGGGAFHWLALEGDINVPEMIQAQPKGANTVDSLSFINNSGDNTLSGTITVVQDDDAEGRTGIGFRVNEGSLTITNPINWEIDGEDLEGDDTTSPLRIVGYGNDAADGSTLRLMSNVVDDDITGSGDPNRDAVSVEARLGVIVELNGANNTYTGPTQVFLDASIVLNGAIPNSSEIILNNPASILDASSLGGLALNSGQTLTGEGMVVGGVIAGSGSTISPGDSPGTLSIEGGLTLNSGAILDIEVGGDGTDLINVLTGQASGSGTITLNVSPAVPAETGSYTILRAPDGVTLTPGNFNVVTNDPGSLLGSVSVVVTATEVQLDITSSTPVTEVLVSSNSGTTVQLYKVQNGVWSDPMTFFDGSEYGGLNAFNIMWDDSTQELFVIENRGEADARPSRVMRMDAAGTLLEVLGEEGTDFAGAPFFSCMAPNGDLVFSTQTIDQPTPAHVVAYRRSGPNVGTFVEVASNADLTANAIEAIELRGVAVTPDNRLFVNDRNNDGQAIMEFNFETGAFVGIFDGVNHISAQGITWDAVGNRLLQVRDVPAADSIDEYANEGTLAATVFNLPPFAVYINGFGEPAINMGIHNFINFDGRLYAARFQQGDVVEINPDGEYDTSRVAATGLTNPSFLVIADVAECGAFDLDVDGDIDATDAELLYGCLAGPDVLVAPVGCTEIEFSKSDGDDDGDVDMADALLFMQAAGCGL